MSTLCPGKNLLPFVKQLREGGDDQMELQKEIDRLAKREKELVGWLDDCNKKRGDWEKWCKKWEREAKNLEYEKEQANNALGACQASQKAKDATIDDLEVKVSGLQKEIEQ